MPRLGQNPMKWVEKTHQPQNITATTIVHIPVLEGYWRESLEVLKLCVQSMRSSTRVPFDLMVFDNGSCETVVNYLVDLKMSGVIQYLILSDSNLGKVGAWNLLFQAAPGEIVSFCDSDVFFLDGWLEASLEILDHFPKAGIVTATPIAGGDLTTLKTAQIAKSDPEVVTKTGLFIPEDYIKAIVKSLGKGEEEFKKRQINRKDVLLSKDGVEAYATASHFQFTTKKTILAQLFPAKSEVPLGGDVQFEDEMVDRGYWRLSTTKYLVHHMGNRVPDFVSELPWLNPEILIHDNRLASKKTNSQVISNKLVRKVLRKIHLLTYELLFDENKNNMSK